MKNTNYALVMICSILLTGCGLSVPGFDKSSSSSNDNSSENAKYRVVLESDYDGYGDDDEFNSADIDKGLKILLSAPIQQNAVYYGIRQKSGLLRNLVINQN